jgi:hypothetical protein
MQMGYFYYRLGVIAQKYNKLETMIDGVEPMRGEQCQWQDKKGNGYARMKADHCDRTM